MRSVAAVIPAGGSGTRLGRATPKQFLDLGDAPILVRTVHVFARHPRIGLVVVAAPATRVARTVRLLRRHLGAARVTSERCAIGDSRRRRAAVLVVAGGAERQDSVGRALDAVPARFGIVVVHDAVRPFVTAALIERVVTAARGTGGAICALPIGETVKRVRDGYVDTTVDRTGLWAVQTPQAFRATLLRAAHDKARRDGVLGTDESMLVERLGHAVRVVPGLAANVKITTPDDLRRSRARVHR